MDDTVAVCVAVVVAVVDISIVREGLIMFSGTGAALISQLVLSSGLSSLLWVFSSVSGSDSESSALVFYSLILGAAHPSQNCRLVLLH